MADGGYSGAASMAAAGTTVVPQNTWAGTVFNFQSAGAGNTRYAQEQNLTSKADATATTAYGGRDATATSVPTDTSSNAGSGSNVALYLGIASLAITLIGIVMVVATRK